MYKYIFLALDLILICAACTSDLTAQPAVDYSLKTGRIISKIDNGKYTNMHGLLLWKDGEIIGEKYWDSWNRDRPHMLQSVTKSITSILIGIAIQEGFLSGTDEPVLGFFTEYSTIQNLDDRKRLLKLEDLLTMRTGMDWIEHPYASSPLARMNLQRDDWIRFVLDTPMHEAPGQSYIYNSGGVILLAGVLREATGMSVQEFASRYLFEPLDITTAEWWFTDRQGLPHTGGGLRMSAGDMLKIGRLVLQYGEWEGRQILDCDYIKRMYRNHQAASIRAVAGYPRVYSLLWHVFPVTPEAGMDNPANNFIAAWGAHGQWIMVFPKQNMVMVFIAGTQNSEGEVQPIRIVYEEILNDQEKQN